MLIFFLAAGDDDVGVAKGDLLGAECHRAQAGAAHLIDAPGRGLFRHTGRNGRLAGRVLPLAGREHLAHDHFVHIIRIHPSALESRTNGHFA